MCVLFLMSLTACSNIDGKYGILVESSQIYVGETSKVSILKIDTEQIVPSLTGWKSDNEYVAIVSEDGEIIGRNPGFANIYIEIRDEVMSTVVEVMPLPDEIFNENGEIVIGLPTDNSAQTEDSGFNDESLPANVDDDLQKSEEEEELNSDVNNEQLEGVIPAPDTELISDAESSSPEEEKENLIIE